MSDGQAALTLASRHAGYDTQTLQVVCDLTFAGRTLQQLDDEQRRQLIDAVDVCVQAAYDARTLSESVARLRAAGGNWRAEFWQRKALPAACRRHLRPDLYDQSRESEMQRSVLARQPPSNRQAVPLRRELSGVPAQLPARFDGQPIARVSQATYLLWTECQEAFRREVIEGVRTPIGGETILGKGVDYGLSEFYRARLRGEDPHLGDVMKLYDDNIERIIDEEHARQCIVWGEAVPREKLSALGMGAIGTFMEKIAPHLGEPIAVQNELRFRVSPHVSWEIVGYEDLVFRRSGPDDDPIIRVLDNKVVAEPYSQRKADRHPQPGTYLTGRAQLGDPANDFVFVFLVRPEPDCNVWAVRCIRTERTPQQMNGMLFRYADMARGIAHNYRSYGPEGPWPLGPPTSERCSAERCAAYAACPGGAGL